MNTHIRRFVMLFVAGLLALTAGLPAAHATANSKASCVGLIVSTEAPAGEFDVNNYKALAGDSAPFGQFVSGGGHEHLGSVEACIPPQ
jgi:hypothetical protein